MSGAKTCLLTALFFISAIFQVAGGLAESGREAVVRRVIDGDTFELENGERVRLIGLNAPEYTPWKRRVDFYGEEATRYTRKLLTGKNVLLEKDIQPRDKYRRALAYVYLEGGVFVNKHLVEEGYAKARYYAPNGRYRRVFTQAQQRAREAKKGLWSGRTS